jgi:hypothetical protein
VRGASVGNTKPYVLWRGLYYVDETIRIAHYSMESWVLIQYRKGVMCDLENKGFSVVQENQGFSVVSMEATGNGMVISLETK